MVTDGPSARILRTNPPVLALRYRFCLCVFPILSAVHFVLLIRTQNRGMYEAYESPLKGGYFVRMFVRFAWQS